MMFVELRKCTESFTYVTSSVCNGFVILLSIINNDSAKKWRFYFLTKFGGRFGNLLGERVYAVLFGFVQIWHFCCTMSEGVTFLRRQCEYMYISLLTEASSASLALHGNVTVRPTVTLRVVELATTITASTICAHAI